MFIKIVRFKKEKGFFPLILSNLPIRRSNYNEDYCNITGCKAEFKEYKLKFPVSQWFANFSENNYRYWGDEHWKEVKPNGNTVKYISSFLEFFLLIRLYKV